MPREKFSTRESGQNFAEIKTPVNSSTANKTREIYKKEWLKWGKIRKSFKKVRSNVVLFKKSMV